ncbi:hypothetical protein [Okibacterium endophyticum]
MSIHSPSLTAPAGNSVAAQGYAHLLFRLRVQTDGAIYVPASDRIIPGSIVRDVDLVNSPRGSIAVTEPT